MTSNSQSADPALARLLLANAQWARAVTEGDINFFPQSVKGQTPEVSLSLPLRRCRTIASFFSLAHL